MQFNQLVSTMYPFRAVRPDYTVLAYRAGYRAGEAANATGASCPAVVDEAFEVTYNCPDIDGVERDAIEAAWVEAAQHGYYGVEPMTDTQVSIAYD